MMIVFLLLLSLLKFTESNWVLEVRLYQYSNPTSRRINGRCCDIDGVSDGICMNPCDNDFLFCLRVDVTSSSCLYGAYRTGLVAGGDELNFTSVALIGENNVSHPLLFNGTQWPENNQVDFLVQVNDLDTTGMNFVGIIGTPLTYTNTSGGPSDIITLRDPRISIEASFDMKCDTDYYGSQCDIFCQTHDEELGHYTCDSQGNRICTGRYDIETNCTMFLPCDAVCNSNQQCIPSNNTCICKDGWRGPACDQCTNCTVTAIAPLSTTAIAPLSTTAIAPLSTTTIAPLSTTTTTTIVTTMIPSTTATSGSLPTNERRTATIIYASVAVGGFLITTAVVVLIIIALFLVYRRNDKGGNPDTMYTAPIDNPNYSLTTVNNSNGDSSIRSSPNYATSYYLATNGNDCSRELPNPLYEEKRFVRSSSENENLYSLASEPYNNEIEGSIPRSYDSPSHPNEPEIVYSRICKNSSQDIYNEGHYEFDPSFEFN